MILAATRQSKRMARRAAAGTVPSFPTFELGKWVANKRSKVSPSGCIRYPVGATKGPSLTLGSLDSALCSLANLGRSFTELQKVLQVCLEALRTSFLYLHWASLKVPN